MDCSLTNTDAHVAGGSEDGFIFFWDLVDASVVSRFRAHASVVIFFLQFMLIILKLMFRCLVTVRHVIDIKTFFPF